MRIPGKTRKALPMKDSRTLALAVAAPFCFGTGFTLAKPAVAHFPPLFMMLLAYSLVAAITLVTVREPIRTPPVRAFFITACGVTIQGALLFWGVRGMDSATANLLLQTQVPAAVFLGWLVLGDQLTWRKCIGTAIAILGVAIIIGLPAQPPPFWPVVFIVSGGVVWSFGQVLVRKWGRDSGILTLKANALYGVPQLLVATLLFESGQWQAVTTASPLQWAMLGFVGIVGFYLAYYAWFSLLRRIPMDEAAPWVLLMTPIGLVCAVLVLGERMTLVQIIGAVVLMAGLAIVNGLGMRRRVEQPA